MSIFRATFVLEAIVLFFTAGSNGFDSLIPCQQNKGNQQIALRSDSGEYEFKH